MNDQEILYEAAKLAEFEACDSIWWRCDGAFLRTFAQCSDVFAWGSADCEEITADNIDVLRQSVADVAEATGNKYDNQDHGFLLFVARVRKMRPQGAMYRYLEVSDDADRTARLRALFDAAGPERGIDLVNPKGQDGVYRYQPPPIPLPEDGR